MDWVSHLYAAHRSTNNADTEQPKEHSTCSIITDRCATQRTQSLFHHHWQVCNPKNTVPVPSSLTGVQTKEHSPCSIITDRCANQRTQSLFHHHWQVCKPKNTVPVPSSLTGVQTKEHSPCSIIVDRCATTTVQCKQTCWCNENIVMQIHECSHTDTL